MYAKALFLKGMRSRPRNSILWSSGRFRTTTPHENRQNVTAVSAKPGQSWYSWLETSPWGWVWRLDILRVIWSENERFEYFGKRASCIFYFPVCLTAGHKYERCGGKKKPIVIFRYSMKVFNHECQRFFCIEYKINLYIHMFFLFVFVI